MINTKPIPVSRLQPIRLLPIVVLMWGGCFQLRAESYHFSQIVSGVDRHHAMISKATKDPFGMIWMLSGSTIFRYDGVNVTPFSRLYGDALPFYEVDQLHADPWGHLWLNTRNGIAIFDLHTWKFVSHGHRLAEFVGQQLIACFKSSDGFFVADKRGMAWSIAARDVQLLFRFDPSNVDQRRPVGRMLVADAEYVWFAFDDWLHRCDRHGQHKTQVRFPPGMFSRIEDLLPVSDGVLVRVYSQGYYACTGETFTYLPRSVFRTNDFTNWNHWSFEEEDKIIAFHEDRYLEFSRDTAFRLLATGSHQLDHHILYKRLNGWQREQDEWLLCTDQGLYSVFPTRIEFDFYDSGSARGMIKQQGTYYFGGYGYLDRMGHGQVLERYTAMPENNYYAFLALSRDTACIVLEGDFLAYLINGRVVPARIDVSPATPEKFTGMAYCVARQSADTLLVGTYNGIWKYALSTGAVSPLACANSGFFSRGMRVQSIRYHAGELSFTTDQGYFTWQASRFRKVYPTSEANLNTYAHAVHGNSVYLATKGQGLVVLDKLGHLTSAIGVEGGLASDIVYQLAWVGDALYLGTHDGLSVLKGDRIYNFFHTDGLPFEEFNHQASYYDETADRLFMGGVGGYIGFRPSAVFARAGDPLGGPRLSGFRIGMKSNRYVDTYARSQLRDTIQLPKDAVWISLGFAQPENHRQGYRMFFRIAPLMDAYQEMPASSQINLSGMSAGDYRLSVKIQAASSGDEEAVRTWLIHKPPVFTETLAFYLLILIAVGGITSYILYERARKAKGEDRLRRRISRDLHDEVGGLLTGISMQTDLLRIKTDYVHSPAVDSIGTYSREATQMMDDIIWAVDSRNNVQGSLADRMKLLATQLLEPLEVVITFDVDQREDRKIPQLVRQNLYLIFKEAIHNICKHAHAKTVHIRLHHTGRRLELTIWDDGVAEAQVTQAERRKGYGQRNMQLRATQIRATFTSGRTETGYEVSVVVPLHRARFWNWFRD